MLLLSFFVFPGVHTDEAWLIAEVSKLSFIEVLSFKPNNYTSSFFPTFAYLFIEAFGPSYISLRLCSLVFFVMTGIVVYLVYRAKDLESYWYATAFVMSWPFLVVYSRFGWELTTLVPFLLALSYYLVMLNRPLSNALSAFLAALACYSHILAAVPVLIYICLNTKRIKEIIFFTILIMPKAIGYKLILSERRYRQVSFDLDRVLELPSIIFHLLFGLKLDLQIVGKVSSSTYLFSGIAFLFAIGLLLHLFKMERLLYKVFGAFLVWICLVAIITPQFAFRYFVMPCFFLLASIPFCLRKVDQRNTLYAAFILLSSMRLSFSFISPYFLKKDIGTFYDITETEKATSYHFANTSGLPDWLEENNIKSVSTSDWFVLQLLKYYKISNGLDYKIVQEREQGTVLVYYDYINKVLPSEYVPLSNSPFPFRVFSRNSSQKI